MSKIIIAGGRDFDNYEYLSRVVGEVIGKLGPGPHEIVSGRAKGADSLGERFAAEHSMQTALFPADWKGLGKRAGFIRNHQMGDYADILVAFWDGQSHGTKDMIDYMKGLGKQVMIYPYQGPKAIEAARQRMIAYWKEPFPEPWKSPMDIPDIPVIRDENLWRDVINPGIIRRGGIPKSALIRGHRYLGSCRNTTEAIWNGDLFEYQRTKFGDTYTDLIEHFSDNPETDIFIPIKDLGEHGPN